MAASPIPRVLWDTTVYIDYLSNSILPSRVARGYMLLSSVVVAELYAGAESQDAADRLDRLFETMDSLGRLVTPTPSDWKQTGKILARIGRKFGFEEIGRSRLTNDVLIAISAARTDAVLCTGNAKDFQRIRQFLDFSFLVA